jgi:hypothetical protein
MGEVGRKRRQFDITKRKQRHEKLKRLREKFAVAKNAAEKDRIRDKIQRIAPYLSPDSYLGLAERPR